MVRLVKPETSEVSEIVNIHLDSFPNFFLSNLGNNVLFQFYSYLLKDVNTIAYCVKDGGVIVGFLFFSKQAKGLYLKLFIRGFVNFIAPLFFAFLNNPYLLKRMIISFLSSRKYKTENNIRASLLSICVRQINAGNGLGEKLLKKLEYELMLQKVEKYYLTTDAENNELTNKFYSKNNFALHSTFLQGKRRMNLYIKELL
jgi:hypothetical protein